MSGDIDVVITQLTDDIVVTLLGTQGPQGIQGATGDTGAPGTGDMNKSVYDPDDNGVIAVAQGGTGAATAGDARTNLGLGALAEKTTVATADVDNDAVTYAKIQNVSAASRILGRGSAAAAGDAEELSPGDGLSISGTALQVGAGTGIVVGADDVGLATVANGRVLANISGGVAAPTPNTMTAILDAIFGAAPGLVLYRGASNWDALALGAVSTLLKSDGTSLAWSGNLVGVGGATAAGVTALAITDPGADRVMIWDESAGSGGAYVPATLGRGITIVGTELRPTISMLLCLSDETTTLTAGTNKLTVSFPYEFTMVGLPVARVGTVSSSGPVTVDMNEAGVSMLSTKLSIDANEKTSTTAATPAVVSDTVIAANTELQFDIDAAGTGAKSLKVFFEGYWST